MNTMHPKPLSYNTTQEPLIIAEYGRNVENMILHLKTLENREQRSKMAKEVVQMMGFFNPQTREIGEYKQKLWHHFFVMAGTDLDIDTPFDTTVYKQNLFENRPIKIDYPKNKINHKHYGKALEEIIESAVIETNATKKQETIAYIVHFMRLCNANWNGKNTISEEDLADNLHLLSKGRLIYDIPENLRSRKITIPTNKQNQQPTENLKRRGRSNNNRNRQNNNKKTK